MIKIMRKEIARLMRENDRLKGELNREQEKVRLLGLLAADVDVDELMDEDGGEDDGA